MFNYHSQEAQNQQMAPRMAQFQRQATNSKRNTFKNNRLDHERTTNGAQILDILRRSQNHPKGSRRPNKIRLQRNKGTLPHIFVVWQKTPRERSRRCIRRLKKNKTTISRSPTTSTNVTMEAVSRFTTECKPHGLATRRSKLRPINISRRFMNSKTWNITSLMNTARILGIQSNFWKFSKFTR